MTTRSIQVTSGASGGRFGLRAKVVAGVVALGCAVALALGGLRTGGASHGQAPATQAAPRPADTLDWEQAERTLVAPAATLAGTPDWEQQERALVAPGTPASTLDWEQQERALVAPGAPSTGAPADTPDWETQERTEVAPGN